MYFQSTRPHPNIGAGFISTQLNRQGASFDVTAYRCEDPTQVFDITVGGKIKGVPQALAPALIALGMGFSLAAVTRFLSQAEVRLEDIDSLQVWDDPEWSMVTRSGHCLNGFDLTVYLVQAMAACPVRAYVMERALRTNAFKRTTLAALLHTGSTELWTSTRLANPYEALLPLLPINIMAPYSFTCISKIPNANWADFLTRSGVLHRDYIRKVYGLDWFYEALLLQLTTTGPDEPSAILSHLEYLTDDQQDSFLHGLLNAVFLNENENTPRVRAADLITYDVQKPALLATLKGLICEWTQDDWDCQVLIALNYLSQEYLTEPARITLDPLFVALHDADSLLRRFCDELLAILPQALCLSDFVAMSNLARLGRFSYDMTGIDPEKVFAHVTEGAAYFLGSQCDYFCDSTSSKAGVDSLVIEGIRDFTAFFRTLEKREFDLHLDYSSFTHYDVLILQMAGVYSHRMPPLPEFAQEALDRFWADGRPE